MPQVDPETEALVSEVLDEVYGYQQEYLMQGLCVTAHDLNSYIGRRPDLDHHNLDMVISEAMSQQPKWVLEKLENSQLPDGFAESAARQEVDLIEFDDPRIDHEFILHPGEDIFEECVEAFRDILCSERGVRRVTQTVRGKNDNDVVSAIAYPLLDMVNWSHPWIPLILIFACIVADKGLENVCAERP